MLKRQSSKAVLKYRILKHLESDFNDDTIKNKKEQKFYGLLVEFQFIIE
jgi:hypothetical protein